MLIFIILFIETNIWNNVLISDDDFEFNSDNEENIDILSIDDDNLSTITNIGSSVPESIGHDVEILLFTIDKTAFQKIQESFLLKEKNDEINWNDIETENFETESVITKFTEEEINYSIESTSDSLTPCVLLDMIDKNIRCCNKFTSTQRPLA